MTGLPEDLAALAAGGKAALARCLSALETRAADASLARLLDAAFSAPRGVVLGLTGPPGVGKSTLTSALVSRLRAAERTVAVIAVDPSSRRSGGALLGDRMRIETDPGDAGVFVRSMAARSRLGGLAEVTYPAAVLMRALFDVVIVETVGVGQSETDIADCADLVVFCAQPGSGDALQFMKAGIMEVPDLVLVTKSDMGAPADRAAADIRGALSLAAGEEGRGPDPVPVLVVSSQTGRGIEEATGAIDGLVAAQLAGGALARLRADQARRWTESRLRESFGIEGVALEPAAVDDEAAPFARFAGRLERLRSLLQKARESR
jgi:LAO/AO transport system kinase